MGCKERAFWYIDARDLAREDVKEAACMRAPALPGSGAAGQCVQL